jgi:hypothetical protein
MRLLAALLAAGLLVPATAGAAPPWSPQALVAQEHVSDPTVLFTAAGGAVFWQRAPDISSAPSEVRAAPLDGGTPLAERRVSPVAGPVAAGRRVVFGGVVRGRRSSLLAASVGRPAAPFAPRPVGHVLGALRGRFIRAVASGSAVAYRMANPEEPGLEYVALARLGRRGFAPATRISPRGEILALTLASNRRGDVLAVWRRDEALEARIVTAGGARSPVRRIARTTRAVVLDAALAADGRAVVGWLEQEITEEGAVADPPRFRAAIRPAGRRFGRPQQLETYPDRVIAGRFGVRVGIAGRRMVAAWTGRHEIRAAIATGDRFGRAHPLGLLGEGATERGGGIADVATGPAGEALVVWLQPNESEVFVLAAPLRPGAGEFGSSEIVSEAEPAIPSASAAFDPITGDAVVAWWAVADAFDRIMVAARPPL